MIICIEITHQRLPLDPLFPALKARFGRPRLAEDLAVVKAIDENLDSTLELVVDCCSHWIVS